MVRKYGWVMLALWTCLIVAGCLKNLASDSLAPKISKDEVKAMLGQSDVVILDVRIGEEWESSEWMIKGAIHEDPEDFKNWYSKYRKEKTFILYCS